MADLELAAVVEALRQELTKAMDMGRSEQLQFQMDTIELTLQVEVLKQGHGKIGWLWEAGVSRQTASTDAGVEADPGVEEAGRHAGAGLHDRLDRLGGR